MIRVAILIAGTAAACSQSPMAQNSGGGLPPHRDVGGAEVSSPDIVDIGMALRVYRLEAGGGALVCVRLAFPSASAGALEESVARFRRRAESREVDNLGVIVSVEPMAKGASLVVELLADTFEKTIPLLIPLVRDVASGTDDLPPRSEGMSASPHQVAKKALDELLGAEARETSRGRVGYVPAYVVVAGDITSSRLKFALARLFAGMLFEHKRRPSIASRRLDVHGVFLLAAKSGADAVIVGAIPLRETAGAHAAELSIANLAFGGMFASRLNVRLRVELGLVYSARSWIEPVNGSPTIYVRTTVSAASVGQVVAEVRKVVREFYDKPPEGDELEAAKNSAVSRVISELETTAGTARLFDESVASGDEPEKFSGQIQRLSEVRGVSLRKAVQSYLDPTRLTLVVRGSPTETVAALRESGVQFFELE